uniref:Uncharacterized protein n=1 Tax=Felis catus TaxID=9685 RepID=A0ABI7YJT4_FELCA
MKDTFLLNPPQLEMFKNPVDQEVETLPVPATQLKVVQTNHVEAQDCLNKENEFIRKNEEPRIESSGFLNANSSISSPCNSRL